MYIRQDARPVFFLDTEKETEPQGKRTLNCSPSRGGFVGAGQMEEN
jgi:hypothetical protein